MGHTAITTMATSSGRQEFIMDDDEILQLIHKMVDEEHALRKSGEMVDDSRMRKLEETLDQCWDLLRQRRARHEFGTSEDGAQPRDIATVEHYEQ